MGRPRDFDLDTATAQAVQVFWTHGYSATSVRMLCEAMSIQPGSFYQAFGSKDACWEAAFLRYIVGRKVPTAADPESIRSWFQAIMPVRGQPRGCMIVNSAIELEFVPAEGAKNVMRALDAISAFFERCLQGRAQPRRDALILANTVLAVHVMARARAKRSALLEQANAALSAVDLPPIE